MRLHRPDDQANDDEPEGGWLEASGEPPSGPLGDVLTTWSVVRHWRGVRAPTAAEAITATQSAPHDDVRASHQELGMLYLSKDELRAMAMSFAASIHQVEANLRLAQSDQTVSVLRHSWQMLNSLRTAVTEARWELMTREEALAEESDLNDARAAGIVVIV